MIWFCQFPLYIYTFFLLFHAIDVTNANIIIDKNILSVHEKNNVYSCLLSCCHFVVIINVSNADLVIKCIGKCLDKCKLACVFLQAVCCADGVHCCPSGFKCDLSHGVCRKGTEQLPWLMKILAKPISKFEPSDLTLTSAIDLEHNPHCVVCPDGRSQCPDGTTCCVMPGGIYGCCPLPDVGFSSFYFRNKQS